MNNKILKIKSTLEKNRKSRDLNIFKDNSGLEFHVDPNVFSPIHFEDSVFFADNMVQVKDLDVLEIGTGTGYFAIKIAKDGANKVLATDSSLAAYNNTLKNVEKFNLNSKIDVRHGNIFDPIKQEEKFDIIFWNIPFCYLDDNTKKKLNIEELDELDNAVFNYEYNLLEEYLKEGFKYLKKNGKLLLGFSPTIGNESAFKKIVNKLGLSYNVIVSHEVDFGGNKEILQIIEFREIMIDLNSVNVSFDSLNVLSDINLKINKGEITTILGPSGSGKTTILRCISGLHKNYEGSITIKAKSQDSYFRTQRIAVVNQGYSSFPWMTVSENILVAEKQKKHSELNVEDIIKSIGLEGFEDYYPRQLSGGMRQRVAIGRAILQDTEILVFDEPFGALDYQTRQQLQLLIKRVKNEYGKTIVFVTHDIEEAIFISDKVVILSKTPSIVVDEKKIEEKIKFSLDNKIRFLQNFINLRREIENMFQNLDSREKLINLFESERYDDLAKLDCWNTFLTNECRKFYKDLPLSKRNEITLDLLNSDQSNAINIGTLMHPETNDNSITSKLKHLLSSVDNYEQKYFLTHAITRLENLSFEEKIKVKKIVYDNINKHVYYDRKYYTANKIYGDSVVLNLLHSHFFGYKVKSYLKNKGWLLLVSSLAHPNTKEILDFLNGFKDYHDDFTRETAIELIHKINNNEIDFDKIRQ